MIQKLNKTNKNSFPMKCKKKLLYLSMYAKFYFKKIATTWLQLKTNYKKLEYFISYTKIKSSRIV